MVESLSYVPQFAFLALNYPCPSCQTQYTLSISPGQATQYPLHILHSTQSPGSPEDSQSCYSCPVLASQVQWPKIWKNNLSTVFHRLTIEQEWSRCSLFPCSPWSEAQNYLRFSCVHILKGNWDKCTTWRLNNFCGLFLMQIWCIMNCFKAWQIKGDF